MPSIYLEARDTNGFNKWAGNKANILGVGVAITSMTQVLDKIDQVVHSSLKKPYFMVTVNPEFIVQAQSDPLFKRILNWADLALPDGAGLRLAGINTIVPGRKLVSALISANYRIFYLGGQGGVAKDMARKFGGKSDPGEPDIGHPHRNSEILAAIAAYQPDILLVAYGAPWQEKWLYSNLSALKSKVVMGVGGTFDYLTGKAKLPPAWMANLGLEWLWRLVHEPWRWRRQLNLLKFTWKVLIWP